MEATEVLSLIVGALLAIIVIVLLRVINRATRGRISLSWDIDHDRPGSVSDDTEREDD